MSDFIFVYITTSSEEEAEKISRALVEARLAACTNIIPGMKSVYEWEGKITESNEVVLLAKTRSVLFNKLEEMVKELHSYTCPCIVALPVSAGSPDFLRWINEQT